MATYTQKQSIVELYVAWFNRVPDTAGLNYWIAQFDAGTSLATISNEFYKAAVGQFSAETGYTSGMSNSALITKLYEGVMGRTGSLAPNAEEIAYWTGKLTALGNDKGALVAQMVTEIKAYNAAGNAAIQAVQDKFNNKMYVAEQLALVNNYSGTITDAKAILNLVTENNASIATALNAAGINTDANTFTLTNNIDTATANVFNSVPVYTPGGNDFINSLQDEDRLTGTGTNPTLNVTLGSVNDAAEAVITPTMNGIQTVNVQVTGSSVQGINFQDSTGLENLNVTRITSNNATVNFTQLQASADNISLSNSTNTGIVSFEHKEEVLTGTADALAFAVTDARAQRVNLVEGGDGGVDQGFYFETVNMTSTGNNDLDRLDIQENGREDLFNSLAAGTTTQTLNVTAGAAAGAAGYLEINSLTANGLETINITANHRVDIAADKLVALDDSNDGITTNDLETVTITGAANVMIDGLDTTKQSNGNATADAGDRTLTVNAGTMTGNLLLGVATAADADASTAFAFRADKDLVVTSGSGNDQIVTYTNLAGDITTNAGNDLVSIRIGNGNATVDPVTGDIEGVSTINTGEGNDTVTARDLMATAADQNQADADGVKFNDVTAAAIITGAGDDTVTVRTLMSQADWNNGVLTDSNADDTYTIKGASIDTGAGNDTVTAESLQENATISTGEGDDTFNTELAVATVLAADTVAAAENNLADSADDLLGAVIDLGAGADTANFIDSTSLAALNTTIVGNDAELRGGDGADVLNVTALDAVTVASRTGTAGVTDTNTTITGFETANFTVANQIDAATAAATGTTANDDNEVGGLITADVARFDTALTTINMVSAEQTMLQNPTTEVYEAGTMTTFELSNLRAGIATNLTANEATGVTAGALANDSQLAINATTGVVTANAGAADVTLNVDMIAAGAADTFTLNVGAASQAFDLSMNMYQTNTADNAKTVAGTTANMTENVVINFADANAHSVNMNGFGDQQFIAAAAPAVAGDVSSTVATSLTINSAAAAGTGIQVDAVNADTIRFNNADGTAVTAANVTVRVNASNNYNITTGSGTDIIDMRADDVRSDDNATAVNRADIINAGAGRDTMIVGGDDNLGNNQLPGTVPSTIIDDDVFENITSVETILVDTNDSAAADTQFITLNEAAQGITNVDTVRFVGTDAHTVNMVVGNDFSVATSAVNGQLTTATSALIIDAAAQTGATTLTIESKDDDSDLDQVNMDVRVAAKGGSTLTFANTGDEASVVEVRISTADEADAHTITNANAGNADGLVDIDVTTGSIDKIVMVEGATSNDGGAEGAMTVTIANAWTRNNGTFEFDASAVLDTDATLATGGATITVEAGDNATLTLRGTQNSDNITGGTGNDTIFGNAGNDVLNGGAGADSIDGGTGNDTIDGGTGADTIVGGEGDDQITGGLGADNLTGGAGVDTFVITAVNESIQSSADTITDFVTGTDKIAITQTVTNGSTVNLGRFAVVANSGDGDNSLDGTNTAPQKLDAYYSTTGQLAIDVDGDGDITDVNDIVINSTGAINAGDINYTITAAGGNNTVRLGQGVDTITTGAGNDTFVIVGSLDAAAVSAYNAAGAGVLGAAASVVNYNDLLSVRTASEANTSDSINAGAGNDTLHVFGTVDLSLVDMDANNDGISEIETIVVHSSVTMTAAQFNEFVAAGGRFVIDGNSPHSITVTGAPAVTAAQILAAVQVNEATQGTGSTLSIQGTAATETVTFSYNATDAFRVATNTSTSVVAAVGADYNGVGGAGAYTVANLTVAAAAGVTTPYNLVDTAANLAAASSAVLNGATNITVNNAADANATAAQALVIVNATNTGTNTFDLVDTAANLVAVGSTVGNAARNITVDNGADANVSVVQATAIVNYTNETNGGTNTYDIVDTGANLAAAAAAVLNGANDITASGTLTVAQATTVHNATNGGNKTYTVTDSATNLVNAAAAVLSGHNVTVNTTATVAQLTTIDTNNAVGTVTYTSITDTALNLATNTGSYVTGAVNVVATDAVTVAQFGTIDGLTTGTVTASAISDTFANLYTGPGVTAGLTLATGVANSAAEPSITVTTAASIAGLTAIDATTTGTLSYTAISDTAANLATNTGSYNKATINVTVTDAATIAQLTTIDATNTTGSLSYGEVSDTAANILANTGSYVSGNHAATLSSGTVTVAQANTINAYTTGVVTGTISTGDMTTLASLTETDNAWTITVTDATVAASALNTLNGKTTVDVTVTAITTLEGSATDLQATYAASADFTGLGDENLTVTGTDATITQLNSLDGSTSGAITFTTANMTTSADVIDITGATTFASASQTFKYTAANQAGGVAFADAGASALVLDNSDTFTVVTADVITGFGASGSDVIDLSAFGLTGQSGNAQFAATGSKVGDSEYKVVLGNYVGGVFTADSGLGADTLIVWDGNTAATSVTQVGVVLMGVTAVAVGTELLLA